MQLTLRVLGLEMLDLSITTDAPETPQRESDVGIAAVVGPSEYAGFEDRKRGRTASTRGEQLPV